MARNKRDTGQWVFVALFSFVGLAIEEFFKLQNKVSTRNLYLVLIAG